MKEVKERKNVQTNNTEQTLHKCQYLAKILNGDIYMRSIAIECTANKWNAL